MQIQISFAIRMLKALPEVNVASVYNNWSLIQSGSESLTLLLKGAEEAVCIVMKKVISFSVFLLPKTDNTNNTSDI